jgi:hypothetical protein
VEAHLLDRRCREDEPTAPAVLRPALDDLTLHGARQRRPHLERAGREVDVGPLGADRFRHADAMRDRNGVERLETVTGDGIEQGPRFLEGQRMDLGLRYVRRIDERRRVP